MSELFFEIQTCKTNITLRALSKGNQSLYSMRHFDYLSDNVFYAIIYDIDILCSLLFIADNLISVRHNVV